MLERPSELHPKTWQILQALRRGVHLSRNRHYQLFRDPHARRGLKLFRYLQSVIHDLRLYAQDVKIDRVVDQQKSGEFALQLRFPMVHGFRTAYLRPFEVRLIAQDAPEVAALITDEPRLMLRSR